ncbi:MAG: sugar phosphate isomerase/epimerase [Planctomycetes bacterium]|nr:sugar phosphate isomerase/epimerase [Planctomycetota bacterium]
MFIPCDSISRRQFTRHVAATGVMLLASGRLRADEPSAKPKLKLGFDNFAVRGMGWKAQELIDYAARLKVDSLLISDLGAFKSLKDSELAKLRARAADQSLGIHVGTWSICPTSTQFKKDWGTAKEHLTLGIRVARQLGSPVLRVILGTHQDRLTLGGIDARIKDTVEVLRSVRTKAMDAGVRIAVENHAGDLHSLELVRLIEAAGKDFVGANIDSGNAAWALELPLTNLENLGPYALTTSLRDTAIWPSEHGFTAQWTAMGEGMVDWKTYFARFAELCPDVPVHIETISGFPHELRFNDEQFWKAWPHGKPEGFQRFENWANRGQAREPHRALQGIDSKRAEQQYQRDELERSLAYCRSLGLGRKRD